MSGAARPDRLTDVTGPPAATAAVRLAVRRALRDVTGPSRRRSAAAPTRSPWPRRWPSSGPARCALVVDHGLQPGSADVAERAAAQCRGLGLDAVVLTGQPRPAPEAAGGAGPAPPRYAALDPAPTTAVAVLLGHTLDDQAETVLLGLARGSGAARAGRHGAGARPLPPAAARARPRDHPGRLRRGGPGPVGGPAQRRPAFARVRVRSAVLPLLEQELGPGIAAALARTAAQLREDADALDALTPDTDDVARARRPAGRPAAARAQAVGRARVRRAVTSAHVEALRALVEDWRGQGPVALPGGLQVRRERAHG